MTTLAEHKQKGKHHGKRANAKEQIEKDQPDGGHHKAFRPTHKEPYHSTR